MIKEQQVPMETILCRCEKTTSLEQKHSGQASLSKCYLTFRLEGQDLVGAKQSPTLVYNFAFKLSQKWYKNSRHLAFKKYKTKVERSSVIQFAKPGNHSGKSIPDKSTEATGTGWMGKTEKFSPKLQHKEEEREKWKLREVNNRRPQKSLKE